MSVVEMVIVGGIPHCFYVPTLEKHLLSVLHMDVVMMCRTKFVSGVCPVYGRDIMQ